MSYVSTRAHPNMCRNLPFLDVFLFPLMRFLIWPDFIVILYLTDCMCLWSHCVCSVLIISMYICIFFYILFLAFHFCRFCVVVRFFHPTTTANDLRLRRIFYPRVYPLHLSSYLNYWERNFSCWMFSAKQGHYWYHFYNVFGMTRSLTGNWTRDLPHSKPALYH